MGSSLRSNPGPKRYATCSLPPELQPVFDRLCLTAGTEGASRICKITTHQVDSLRYGGRAGAAVVERVAAALREMSKGGSR